MNKNETGLYIRIDIIKKCVDKQGKILWYLDKNMCRYNREDIEYIINNRELPVKLNILMGNCHEKRGYPSKINMQMAKNGVLRRIDGTVEPKKVYNNDTICVITEDSGSGYILVYNLLTRGFPYVKFKFIHANGISTIKNKVIAASDKYKKILVVIDNKLADVQCTAALSSIASIAHNKRTAIAVFKPLSIEEVILSWSLLQRRKQSVYYDIIVKYAKDGHNPFKYLGNDIYSITVSDKIYRVHNLEKVLFEELHNILAYKYSKSDLSQCLYSDCCNLRVKTSKKVMSMQGVCKNRREIHKIPSIFRNSLAGGLYNCVTILLDKCYYMLNSWEKDDLDYLYIIFDKEG